MLFHLSASPRSSSWTDLKLLYSNPPLPHQLHLELVLFNNWFDTKMCWCHLGLSACHWSGALATSGHEQPEVLLLLTLVVWQGREAAALEMPQWKPVPEFSVSVTILLQYRVGSCNFPGFKGEDGRARFQCWAFLLHVPLSPPEHWVFPPLGDALSR